MPTITTEVLLHLATAELWRLRQRADSYLQAAIAAAGTKRALTYSRLLDALADEASHQHGIESACGVAGDNKAADAIQADRAATAAAIGGHAYTARMVSIPGWCWVSRSFKPAAAPALAGQATAPAPLAGAADAQSPHPLPSAQAGSAGTEHPAAECSANAMPAVVLGRCIATQPDGLTGLLTPTNEVADPRCFAHLAA